MSVAEANPISTEKPGEQPVSVDTTGFLGFLLTLVLSGFALWYGFKYGNLYAPWFWNKVQSYGIAIGAFFGNSPDQPSVLQKIGNAAKSIRR